VLDGSKESKEQSNEEESYKEQSNEEESYKEKKEVAFASV